MRYGSVIPRLFCAAAVALVIVPLSVQATTTTRARAREVPRLCRLQTLIGPEYYRILLRPTGPGPQSSGEADLSYSDSPFGVAVTGDGRYAHDMKLVVRGLPDDPSVTYIVWVAPPNLSAVRKLGPIKNETEMKARLEWNKFLLFVSAEPDPKVERWAGKILLTGISRSGLMHTFAGHGPFESALC
jgi:hypothetical protein